MTTMDSAAAKKLRAPFKPEQIGKLPKPTKKENPKGKCNECGGWHGLPAVHLDYVGHAATTDRLLEVDPSWTWEPMARGPQGEPLLVNDGLWINLTVCGVTRPGFGDGTSMKEVIGDAIRNAAMRFGVALDLWSKEDLHATESAQGNADEPVAPKPKPKPRASGPATTSSPAYATEEDRRLLFDLKNANAITDEKLREILKDVTGQETTAQIPKDKFEAVLVALAGEDVPF